MITDEERAELERLEATFADAGGRGVDAAERIDFLSMKASFPTVGDVARYFASLADQEDTFVFASEEEVPTPCEFVTFAGFLEDFYQELI